VPDTAAPNGLKLLAYEVVGDEGIAGAVRGHPVVAPARDRDPISPEIVRQQYQLLEKSLPELPSEGFDAIQFLNSVAEIDSTEIRRHS
jgi:hypothetical protein